MSIGKVQAMPENFILGWKPLVETRMGDYDMLQE
jgi:hypothetical protein